MSGGNHTIAECGCVWWDEGGVSRCARHEARAEMLRRAGVHLATRSMHRPDRVTVKPPTRWERFVLWLARRLPRGSGESEP